jgi:hypothetical protein
VLYRAVTGPVFPAVRLLTWTLQVRSLWQHRASPLQSCILSTLQESNRP